MLIYMLRIDIRSICRRGNFRLLQYRNWHYQPRHPTAIFFFEVNVSGNCSVALDIPHGLSLTYTQSDNIGSTPKVSVTEVNSGLKLSEQAGPNPRGPCLPRSCIPLTVGSSINYSILVNGVTPNLPGRYMRNVKLLAGSTNTSQTFGQNIRDIYISYTVSSPPCRLDSARNMTLEFQTLNSNDFASAQQYANILLSCTTPTQVTASLNPVQNPIAGLQGVSATSLEGLNMATTWADSNAAVIFGYPRSMSLRKGDNTISLGFKPKLNSSASPTGYFSSQYTLNIVYL